MEGLTTPQKCLKKAGPKPSGPGLESFFIIHKAFLISEVVNCVASDELWKESSAVGASKEPRLSRICVGEETLSRLG